MGNAAFQEKSFAEAATHYRSVSEWQEISERGGERERGEGEGERDWGSADIAVDPACAMMRYIKHMPTR
jgi:hypothetical protein